MNKAAIHIQLNGHEFEQTPGEDNKGQGSLECCSPWGHEASDTTEHLHFHFSLSCIGEGNGNPLQYFSLGNPMDRSLGAIIHGVTKSWTQLRD